ncbi:MAG: PAS domain S-box protein [Acidimicrobiales bacterium]|jgi:PAS domain S-box-containing protein
MLDNPDVLPLPSNVSADDLWLTSPDALLVVESAGIIKAANPAAHDLFVHPQGSMPGYSIEQLLPPAARERHVGLRNSYEKSPHSRSMGAGQRLEGLAGDGRVFPVHVSLSPVRDGSNLTIAAVRDMSDWVDAEHELEEARRRTNRAEDHERIARGLHDTVIQEIFAAGLALQALKGESTDSVAERLAEIITGLDTTTRSIRSVIFDLSSPVHSSAGLRSRATDLVRDLRDSLNMKPRCHFVGPLDTAVPDDLVEESLAVIRESLTNVARHAEAKNIDLSITADNWLTIEIVDDGRGLPEKSVRHSGLANLFDRADRRDGTFNAVSAPTGGTVITWSVPLVITD